MLGGVNGEPDDQFATEGNSLLKSVCLFASAFQERAVAHNPHAEERNP